MTVDTVRLRSGRRRREADAAAAKQRKQKIILIVGLVILAIVAAIEVPSTLSKLSSSPAPAPIAAPGTTGVTGATSPAATASVKAQLARLQKYSVKDPFVPQVGTPRAPAGVITPRPPAVRLTHFVTKNPFIQQVSVSSPLPGAAPTGGKPGAVAPAASATGGYIVLLASVPVASGRSEALRVAQVARRHGVAGVSVLTSSAYPSLRSGFFAVYSGRYRTLSAALAALQSARGKGYVSAYTRIIGK